MSSSMGTRDCLSLYKKHTAITTKDPHGLLVSTALRIIIVVQG